VLINETKRGEALPPLLLNRINKRVTIINLQRVLILYFCYYNSTDSYYKLKSIMPHVKFSTI